MKLHDVWANFMLVDGIVYLEYIHTHTHTYAAPGSEPIMSCQKATGSLLCPQTVVGRITRSFMKKKIYRSSIGTVFGEHKNVSCLHS